MNYDQFDEMYSPQDKEEGRTKKFAQHQFEYYGGTQTAKTLAGWIPVDFTTGEVIKKDGTLLKATDPINYNTDVTVYGTRDNIPSSVRALRPVWKNAKVIFVSSSGSDSRDGLSPETAVKTIAGAYAKLNMNEPDATNQIIVVTTPIITASSN